MPEVGESRARTQSGELALKEMAETKMKTKVMMIRAEKSERPFCQGCWGGLEMEADEVAGVVGVRGLWVWLV